MKTRAAILALTIGGALIGGLKDGGNDPELTHFFLYRHGMGKPQTKAK